MVYLTRLLLMDLGYFLSFTIINGAVTKKLMYVSFLIFTGISLGYIPRSGIAESEVNAYVIC